MTPLKLFRPAGLGPRPEPSSPSPSRALPEGSHVLRELRENREGLLVQLAGLGDLVMALPTIKSLLAALPHVRWTLLTRPAHGEFFGNLVHRVSVMPWPPALSTVWSIATEVLRLRRWRFDVAVHLYGIHSRQGAVAMKALFLGIHPRLSIGRVASDGWRLFDVSWEEQRAASKHEVDLNLAMVQSLGIPIIEREPSLSPQPEAVVRVNLMLGDEVLFRKPFVAIFPGGVRMTRHWPTGNYQALAARLSASGFRVCVVGGGSELRDAQSIAEAAGANGLNLAGRLSLQDTTAVLSMASVYVGNDSGPTHLAAALGVPCIALFGPEDAERFRPRGNGPIRILQHKVDCSPCYLTWCSHHTCMRSLTFESVLSHTMELLGHT